MPVASSARLRRAAALGLGVGLLGLLLSLVPRLLELDETLGLGLLFALRGPAAPPSSVAVVGISPASGKAIGQSNLLTDWPRTEHAKLVEALAAAGVRVIVFDLLFAKPRERSADLRFANAIVSAGNVILVEHTDTTAVGAGGVIARREPPLSEFAAGALATAPFVLPTVPFSVSQFWAFDRADGATPSLPFAALQAHLLDDYEPLRVVLVASDPALGAVLPRTREELVALRRLTAVMRAIRGAFQADPSLQQRVVERLETANLDRAVAARLVGLVSVYAGPSSRYLNYYGPAGSIPTIPIESVLTGREPLDLTNKTVFVGSLDPRQHDQGDLFHSVFSQRTGVNLSGVEIGATAFANLLAQDSIVPLGRGSQLAGVLLWGIALGGLLSFLSSSRAIAVAVAAVGIGIAAVYWLFAMHALWLPLLVPAAIQAPVALGAVLFINYRELARQRHRIEVALSHYVPAAEVRRLASAATATRSDNRLLRGTCLFTDAEQYTTVAESLHPEALAALMNDYYRVMFEVVEQHGGFVSDTAGDSMVAVWATAEHSADVGARACRAALEILDAVERFNRRRSGEQLPTRVGLDAGEMLLGNIGAAPRLEYRAIGDIVNTASRIQGLNRLLRTRLLVSESALVLGRETPGASCRDVGTFVLRGKKNPVRLYELSPAHGADGGRRLAEEFSNALALFRTARWSDAHDAFLAIVRAFPDDGPSAYYAEQAAGFMAHAPKHWDGALRIDVK